MQNPQADAAVRRWLPLAGSLTGAVKAVAPRFGVRRVFEGWASPHADEAACVGLVSRHHGRVWTRDVLLCDGGVPLVFAHSIALREDLAAWPWLRGLGNRPLGHVLFQHHGVTRGALSFCRTDRRHPLYAAASRHLPADDRPRELWARRSVFWLAHAPLLVTEVFLPELLRR